MSLLKCISPIDGSVFAERATLEAGAARALVDRARAAQAAWAVALPLLPLLAHLAWLLVWPAGLRRWAGQGQGGRPHPRSPPASR